MNREDILNAIVKYVKECPMNYITAEQALVPEDVGMRMYDDPIIAIGSADDPMWEGLKDRKAVGPLFRTPKEWLPGARTVISYFAPFSEAVRTGNEKDRVEVGNGWLYARVDGQNFLNSLNHHLEDVLSVDGHRAFSPYSSPEFMDVREAGTNPNVEDPLLSFTSNWSERHVAYICGLGTFGLSKGLITKKGVSGRYGSIITDWELPADVRPYTGLYDYCIMCGACARNCPGNAITKEEGKKHSPCQTYVSDMGKKYAPRFGCGKCQVNVPCERGIPNPKFR